MDYWHCATGFSAMNAIGTQVRDPINSGLTRWRMAVSINGRSQGNREESSTTVSLSVENVQADAGRDG